MNESGAALPGAARAVRDRRDAEPCVIVHDELDLAPGTVRLKAAAASPATTGCAPSRRHLRTDDFLRVRIGVGKPPVEAGRRELGAQPGPRSADAETPLSVALERAADADRAASPPRAIERAMGTARTPVG